MGASKHFPTVESVTEHYRETWHRGEVRFSGQCAEAAAREVRRVVAEYEIPIDEDAVVVGSMGDATHAQGSMMPYGCEVEMVDGDWHVVGEPDGYVVLVSDSVFGGERDAIEFLLSDTLEDTVRHELAHVCCFEEDGYTAESEGNHMDWLERLDAAHTTNGTLG